MAENVVDEMGEIVVKDDFGVLFFNILDKHGWSILVAALAIIILWKGLNLVSEQIKSKGLGPYNFKALGLVLILPIVLMLGAGEIIDSQVLSTLLGAIAGYIFGIEGKHSNLESS